MKPEDIPQELVDLLDERADKVHNRTGSVLTTLADILTLWEEIRRRKIREANKTSMYGEMLAELGNRMKGAFAKELWRHDVRFPASKVTCACGAWDRPDLTAADPWGEPFRQHVSGALVAAVELRGWLPVIETETRDDSDDSAVVLRELQKHASTYNFHLGTTVCSCGEWRATGYVTGSDYSWVAGYQSHVAAAITARLDATRWTRKWG